MKNTHQVFLISDSTGETLDRIFMALKAQFNNFNYDLSQYSFTRTENQISTILDIAKKKESPIILYTVVNSKLAKFLAEQANNKKIPCFGVLGDLILNFSKILNQKATHQPSAQHVLDDDYYKRIEAIQFTMNHDDGNNTENIKESDIVLIGVSRTSKTPTSIYLANKGLKTSNIPLVNEMSIPFDVSNSNTLCVVGLTTEAERLYDIRRNRLNSLKENEASDYTNLDKIRNEVEQSKKIFKKNKWPVIDVTRKSVEETAASIIKIFEIQNKMVEIILASKSKVREKILKDHEIICSVKPSNIDEEPVKYSLLKEGASPEIISKNLAELKANKVSNNIHEILVLGADSVIDLNGELISKPENRKEALNILKKLNGKKHSLISSVCISKNGSMIWNHTDRAYLTMKNFSEEELKIYLTKISDEDLYAYNVYQIEGEGKKLFTKIDGDENTIMGLPVKKIKEYLYNYK